jgi:hypothetical protein
VNNINYNTDFLRFGIADSPAIISLASLDFPQIKFIPFSEDKSDVNKNILNFDAIFLGYYQARAFMSTYPEYSIVVPKGLTDNQAYLIAFALNKNDLVLLRYLNYWLDIKKGDGFKQEQYDHWILGNSINSLKERWNLPDWVLSKFFKQ